jgi:hypothetical protein
VYDLRTVVRGCQHGIPGRDYIQDMASSTVSDARQGSPEIHPDLLDLASRVHTEFDGRLDPLAVDECLNRVAAQFDDATVRAFVPLLVRRYVRDELHERLRSA